MELSEKEAAIHQLLSLPRTETRNAPVCCVEAASKGLRLADEAGYQLGRAYAYLALGECSLYAVHGQEQRERGAHAAADLAKAWEIFRSIGEDEGLMLADLALGLFYLAQEQLTAAEEALRDAETIAKTGAGKRLNDGARIDALNRLGAIRMRQELPDEAAACFDEAFGICLANGFPAKSAEILQNIGRLELVRGKPDVAAKLLLRSVDIASGEGEFRIAADGARLLSRIRREAGDLDEFARQTERSAQFYCLAVEAEARSEFKTLRAYYVKENARVITNAERHIEERILERNLKLEEANWQLNTIYTIGQNITASLETEEVLHTLYTELGALMKVDDFYIAAYNEEDRTLEYHVIFEAGKEIAVGPGEHRRIPKGDLAYWCVNNENTLVINDIAAESQAYAAAEVEMASEAWAADTDWAARMLDAGIAANTANAADTGAGVGASAAGTSSEGAGASASAAEIAARPAAAPASAPGTPQSGSAVFACLKTKGRLFGVLCVRSGQTNAYSLQQVKLLDAVSSYISIAIDNAAVYRKLDELSKSVAGLANHDSLTGIPNRRLLFELVPKAYAGALRTNVKVAFLFMDLDNFKTINDSYGHQAGDEVLKIFTDRVLGVIRSSDIFARVGGDEFVVVMTDLKVKANAGMLARKIIREVAKPIVIQNVENHIGVSIGISVFPDDSRDTDVLIVMADEAMYRVKKDMKNSFAFFNRFNETT
jgi:diguanylate cyclase (GGDEF)-like protein